MTSSLPILIKAKNLQRYILKSKSCLSFIALIRKKKAKKDNSEEEEDEVSERGNASSDLNNNEDFPDYCLNGYHPMHLG